MGMWMTFVCLWKQISIMMTFEFPFPFPFPSFLYSLLPFFVITLGLFVRGNRIKGEVGGCQYINVCIYLAILNNMTTYVRSS